MLKCRANVLAELISDGTVNETVVIGQGKKTNRADREGIVNDEGCLLHGPQAKDGNVWLVDYRGCEDGSEYSKVGDGKRASFHFLRLKSL